MQITTKTGFSCDFDVDALDDWELHDILLDAAGTVLDDSRFARAVMQKCISKEDAERLKDHVRKQTGGRLSAKVLVGEVMSLMEGTTKGKNSSASSAT